MRDKLKRRFVIDWVLINELALGPAPRAERHLDRLEDAGINAIFSLCSSEEAPPPYSAVDSLVDALFFPTTAVVACLSSLSFALH